MQKKLKLKQRTTNAVWSCRVPGRMTFGVLRYSDVAGSALPNGSRWYGTRKVHSKVLYVPLHSNASPTQRRGRCGCHIIRISNLVDLHIHTFELLGLISLILHLSELSTCWPSTSSKSMTRPVALSTMVCSTNMSVLIELCKSEHIWMFH